MCVCVWLCIAIACLDGCLCVLLHVFCVGFSFHFSFIYLWKKISIRIWTGARSLFTAFAIFIASIVSRRCLFWCAQHCRCDACVWFSSLFFSKFMSSHNANAFSFVNQTGALLPMSRIARTHSTLMNADSSRYIWKAHTMNWWNRRSNKDVSDGVRKENARIVCPQACLKFLLLLSVCLVCDVRGRCPDAIHLKYSKGFQINVSAFCLLVVVVLFCVAFRCTSYYYDCIE